MLIVSTLLMLLAKKQEPNALQKWARAGEAKTATQAFLALVMF
jgi:hypothetical protein